MATLNSLDKILDALADNIAVQVAGYLNLRGPGGKTAARAAKSRGGRKLDMGCRVAGCKNRSRGPRFGFICDEHRRTLKKSEQAAARAAWNAKKNGA
jgi:hypothetical protein